MAMAQGQAARPVRRTNIIAYFLQSGSPRVLNALRISGQIQEDVDNSKNRKLLFRTPILNRSVIFKDLVVVENGAGAPRAVRVGTKLYLPFDAKRLDDGGQTFFYDRRTFSALMGEFVDISDPRLRDALSADAQILDLLETLPTFAPFLLRDSFTHAKIEADPLYAAISESEWDEIRAFIRERFRQILSAVSGNSKADTRDALNRLLDKLWDLSDLPVLEALAGALGLPKSDCMSRFYAWKGTLYFCWAFETLQRAITEMGSWLNDWPRLTAVYPPQMREGAKMKFSTLHTQLFAALRTVEMILSEYERAFNDLFVHQVGPQRFINFLNDAPSKFSECGSGIGTLQHAYEIWDRLTEPFPGRQVSFPIMDELTYALDSILSHQY